MSAEIENLVKEGKAFIQLKRTYDQERFPDVGTPAYLISNDWMEKYKKYCFYQNLKYNDQPEPAEDHLQTMHPGPVTNASLLHQEDYFLKGTGTLTDFETEAIDTYLHKDSRERMHFEIYNKAIWDFLHEKYGSDHAIKRFYINKGMYSTFSELECRLTKIPVKLVYASELNQGQVDKESFKPSYI